MRNGNVIGKIFLNSILVIKYFMIFNLNNILKKVLKKIYFSIIQQTTNYRNYLLQKDIKLLQFSLYSRLYNKN